MKRRITSFLLIMAMVLTSFLQPLSVQAAGETEEAKNYSVTLPAGYDDNHSYPVVYVMPQDGLAQDDSGITAQLQAAMDNGSSADVIIVKPSFTKDSDVYAEMDAIIAEVDANYNTIADANHRAIVGTGVGGYLAYILGYSEEVISEVKPEAPEAPVVPEVPAEPVEKEDICVNTTVTTAGQYPVSIEVKVDDATGLDALTAADFTVAGQSAGWLTSTLHDFTATFKEVKVDGNVVTLMFGEFPERYPFVDNYTVTCAANEALTFKVTKDTQHFTPIADEFEQIRKADGGAYDYNLFTPADTSKPQPIVIVFHGFGDDENLYHNRLATAWADPANQAKRPAYVLAPMFGGYSMYSQSGRIPTYENVYNTVQQMIAEGKVDPNRVYVTGKSYGGGAVYEFTERYPEFAAGAIAMCGQSTSPYSDVQANLDKIVDLPLWIAHATEDPTVKISCSRDVYAKLQELGSTVVKFTEYATDEMPTVAPDNKVIGPELNGIESLHGVEAAVLEDQAYMEWLFAQSKPVEPEIVVEYKALTAPKNFKFVASTRGDFVSKDNIWAAKYGSAMDFLKAVGSKNLAKFFTYLDAPVADKYTDMEGSSNDIGQWIINSGAASNCVEFTARPGSFTDEFLAETLSRFTSRMTSAMLSGVASGSVTLGKAALPSDVETVDVSYSIKLANALTGFSSVEEDVKVIISVVDIANNATGPKELASVSVDAKAAAGGTIEGTVAVDNLVNGASSSIQLSVEMLGAVIPVAKTTLTRIQDTVVDGDFQYLDLMGDWYFHYTGKKARLDGIENLLETAKAENWPIVTPALTSWTKGFGDVTSSLGGDYFDYGITGDGYYVRSFDLPADFDAKELVLSIGYMDDRGEVFINGTRVGGTGMTEDGKATGDTAWAIYSAYEIDPSVLNIGGTNVIVVRNENDGIGGGGWYGGPVALYSKLAFESDESTNSLFDEYSFDSKYAASAQGKTGTVENKYLVYLPEGYHTSNKHYPTVYLMHQYNSDHTSYIVDDVDTLINEAIKQALLDEMIVVVPNSAESSWWRGDWMKMVSDELVPLIDSTYRTINDARYRFTAGCSMGGQGAFGVALQNPDLFSGAVSFFGAFSYGGNADPRQIAQKESVEYMQNYAMYFICGNQDIYQFGSDAIDLHQILLEKGIDHEFFIDNGEHNSVFYLPHFIEGFKYVRDNMYKSSADVASCLDAEVSVDKNANVTVDFRASKGISAYFNNIPASSYTKDETPDLSIPLTVKVEQGGKVVFEAVEKDFSISRDNRSDFFKYDVSDYVVADEQYTVTVEASIFDRVITIADETLNKAELKSAALSAKTLVYNGKSRIPTLKVVNEYDQKLVKGTDYTVTITNEEGKVVTSPTSVGKYTVKVSYIGAYKGTKASKMTYTIVPAAVKNMKANLAKYNSVKVSWTKATGATEYYVYYKKSTASKYSSYKKVTGTTATIANLAAGAKYNFKVVPAYDDVKSTAYTTKTVTTLKKVTNVKVVRNGKKVTVSWKNIAGETGYEISRATKKAATANVKAYPGAALSKKDITLSKAQTYFYKVRAYKTVDGKKVYGPWSAAVSK